MVEVEPASELALAKGAEAEIEIEEMAQAQQRECEADTVDFMEVDYSVRSQGIEYFVYLDEALSLLHSQIFHIAHATEERLQ